MKRGEEEVNVKSVGGADGGHVVKRWPMVCVGAVESVEKSACPEMKLACFGKPRGGAKHCRLNSNWGPEVVKRVVRHWLKISWGPVISGTYHVFSGYQCIC